MLKRKLLVALTALTCCVGCQATDHPTASIGDAAVFTSLHLLSAEASTDIEGGNTTFNNGPFTAAQMKRYFETNSKDFANQKAHADDLLDANQGGSAFFEATQSSIAASLAATFAKNMTTNLAAPTAPSVTQPVPNDVTNQLQNDAKAAFAALLSTAPTDSPFNQLDRVADFYGSYVIKNLRVRGDSRVIDPDTLASNLLDLLPEGSRKQFSDKLEAMRAKGDAQSSRLLLIVFQTHISPGNQPNQWAGVRLTVSKTTSVSGAPVDPSAIRVIRLHPTHTYSTDMQSVGRSNSHSLATSLQGSASLKGLGVGGQASQSSLNEDQERRRFLSRITESTSFADAAEHTFGYNFYPSNVRVERSHNPLGFVTGGSYRVEGFLEGGGRDCAAILVVPQDLASIQLDVNYVWGNINSGSAHTSSFKPDTHSIIVSLPKWNPVELLAATLGAGPTVHAAKSANDEPTPTSGK